MRKAVSAAIINDNKEILLVKKRDTWILPWWKPEKWETDIDCLEREISEELSWASLKNPSYYRSVTWITPHSWDLLKAKVYFAELIADEIKHSAEIVDAKFIDNFSAYKVSDITTQILDCLKKPGNL